MLHPQLTAASLRPGPADEARTRARLDRLQTATAAFARALTLEEVAAAANSHGLTGLGAVGCNVGVLAPSGDCLDLVHSIGYDGESEDRLAAIRLDEAFPSAEAVRTGAPAMARTRAEFLANFPDASLVVYHADLSAILAVPMVVEGQVVGTLSYGFAEPQAFTKDDVAFAQALAEQAGQAVHRVRLLASERAAREDAEAARAEAEKANRAKSEFLRVMSHELRTPLTAIGGYAELVSMGIHGPVTPAQEEALRRVVLNQQHLLFLINEVLSFARIEAGKLEYRIREVAVAEVVTDAAELLRPSALAKSLSLEVAPIPPSLAAQADPERLRQILVNLIENAVKFTERGRVRIEATQSAEDDRPAAVQVSVSDTGPGIPPDHLHEIFEAFTRVDSRYTRTTPGVGLGLAIAKELAVAMGGTLAAESTLGEGSMFVLTLPAAAAAHSVAGTRADISEG